MLGSENSYNPAVRRPCGPCSRAPCVFWHESFLCLLCVFATISSELCAFPILLMIAELPSRGRVSYSLALCGSSRLPRCWYHRTLVLCAYPETVIPSHRLLIVHSSESWREGASYTFIGHLDFLFRQTLARVFCPWIFYYIAYLFLTGINTFSLVV